MRLRPVGRASVLRAALAALACTGAATVLAHPFTERVSVTSIYLLAVVAAAALGGVWGGLGAALLAFLGLNFFFTAPRHTFRVERLEDLVALVVFLVGATIVCPLPASAERGRAPPDSRSRNGCCWRRSRSRPRSRSNGHRWPSGYGARRSSPRPTRRGQHCSRASRTTCGPRSRRSRQASPTSSTPRCHMTPVK